MKCDAILVVGNITPSNYAYFKRAGVPMLLLAGKLSAHVLPPREDFVEVVPTDFHSDEPFRHYQQLARDYNIVAQMPGAEDSVLFNAQLAELTGLAAPSVEAARRARDKAAMKAAFTAGLGSDCTARSAKVLNLDEAATFTRREGFPVVLKPADLYGSMFGTIAYDAQGLERNYRQTSAELADYLVSMGRGQEPVVMQVETFLEGGVHAVEALVGPDGAAAMFDIFDTLTERDAKGGLDNFEHYARYAPSAMPTQAQAACKAFCARAVESLGLSNCIAHVEFIATRDGPRLLEVAARVGGNRDHLTRAVFGLDLMQQYFELLRGNRTSFDTEPKWIRPRAIFTAFPRAKGRYVGVIDLQRLQAVAGYVRHAARISPGTVVGPANRGFLPALSIELEAPTLEELLVRIQEVRDLGPLVHVEPD